MKTQTFNDGVVKIYQVDSISDPGDMPNKGVLTLKTSLRYQERTVGVTRYWAAMKENTQIERLIRTPKIKSASIQDIAILNDKEQYKIVQIQYPEGLQVMDLSLERLDQEYEIN